MDRNNVVAAMLLKEASGLPSFHYDTGMRPCSQVPLIEA